MSTKRFGPYAFEVEREEKLLFPQDGFSKGDLMAYYSAVAPYMVPHLQGRPLTLQRFPDGISEDGFFQQQASDYFPDWLERATVEKKKGQVTHVVVLNEATLVYLASQACICLHAWLSRIDRPREPDRMVFDLDPPGDSFDCVIAGAVLIRETLADLGMVSFVMSTGSRGVHVVVPITRAESFDETREFAKAVAYRAARERPKEVTVEQRKAKRRGRLYLDVMRNAYGQTGVAPYSVRAMRGAPVATPLTWDELEGGKMKPADFTLENVPARLEGQGDVW
ncbi:MAG: non-homologous end-joining DNA ligase, partial [Rhodothermia bacterium]|nr:non-homologous end-joining DNA ligase [Rhodothermia bacterium]